MVSRKRIFPRNMTVTLLALSLPVTTNSCTPHNILFALSEDLLTESMFCRLAEFKYGGVPKETFAPYLGSQDKPNALYYYLKKDFFPYIYWNSFVKGTWFGPKGPIRPINYMAT